MEFGLNEKQLEYLKEVRRIKIRYLTKGLLYFILVFIAITFFIFLVSILNSP